MSIDAYNQWFLEYAPDAFQLQRSSAAADVCSAMDKTANFRKIDNKVLMEHPEILPTLRMATCPPVARDRLVGLAGTGKNLVSRMEKKGTVPPRMSSGQLARRLSRIGTVVRRLIDTDLCPWVAENRDATQEEIRRAAIVVADRLCGTSANPLIRRAQEIRQINKIKAWLTGRGYHHMKAADTEEPQSMLAGTFACHINVAGWLDKDGVQQVKIPVDTVIQPRNAAEGSIPLFIEAKSAGDFANVNKRRKEEATRARQLRHRFGPSVQFVLFLGGYFDSGYLGYEAAEGIDWVWEHRIEDFTELGL